MVAKDSSDELEHTHALAPAKVTRLRIFFPAVLDLRHGDLQISDLVTHRDHLALHILDLACCDNGEEGMVTVGAVSQTSAPSSAIC